MARERAARPRAPPFIDPPGYARHRPEATLLYELVERYYPELVTAREAAGRPLPKHVQEEFAAYLQCGRLEHGFLRRHRRRYCDSGDHQPVRVFFGAGDGRCCARCGRKSSSGA